jgi:hypothetical protein
VIQQPRKESTNDNEHSKSRYFCGGGFACCGLDCGFGGLVLGRKFRLDGWDEYSFAARSWGHGAEGKFGGLVLGRKFRLDGWDEYSFAARSWGHWAEGKFGGLVLGRKLWLDGWHTLVKPNIKPLLTKWLASEWMRYSFF